MLPIQRKISPYNHYDSNNPQWIIIHYVGGVSSAKNNVDYFYGGDRNASAQYFVDDNSIWQSVEDFNGAWHIGNSVREPNNWNSIGIEMCCQVGLIVSEATEDNTVELVQYLMKKYNIDIDHVVTHAWTTNYSKICPNWSNNNWSRWISFLNKVSNQSAPQPSSELYRVRKSWVDSKSQLGAYSVLENAKANCPVGYSVFDSNGNCVYTNSGSKPTPPPKPSMANVDVFYKVAVIGKGKSYYPFVKNLKDDYAGDKKNSCCLFVAYPSSGTLYYRVSPINESRYYPEISNYKVSSNYYDEAGVANVPFDKIQIRYSDPNYKVRYRVMCNGKWLSFVENSSSYLNGESGYAGLSDGVPITAIQVEIVPR